MNKELEAPPHVEIELLANLARVAYSPFNMAGTLRAVYAVFAQREALYRSGTPSAGTTASEFEKP